MTDLLPCPQCNLAPMDRPTEFAAGVSGWGWVLQCSNRHHLRRTAETREKAIEKWNFSVLMARKPEFDEAGYPADQTLEDISRWKVESKSLLQTLFVFIEETLNLDYGSFSVEGEVVRIVTGGWSGNEAVIGALQQNLAFWGLCWESSHRGGLHWFYSPERVFRAVPPEPRSLIIDEATPFGEAEALYLSRLVKPTQPEEGGLKVGAEGRRERLSYTEFQKVRALAKAKYGSPADEKHFGSIPIKKVFTGKDWELVVDLREDPWFLKAGFEGLSLVYLDPGLWPFREEIEAFADLCHQQWSGWMQYLFQKSRLNDDGSVTIPAELAFRWKRQVETLYPKLSPPEQESDRKEAVKFFRLFLSFLRLPEDIIQTSELCHEDKTELLRYDAFRRHRATAEKARKDGNELAYAEFRKVWAPELAAIESEDKPDE